MTRLKMIIARMAIAAAMLVGGSYAAVAENGTVLQRVVSSGKLRIAVIGSHPPYSIMTVSGELEGYDIDIAKKLAAALKLEPEFVVTDIPGRVASLQTGKVDVTIAAFTRNVERSLAVAFTDPYAVSKLRLMVRADHPAQSLADLAGGNLKVAIVRGGIAERAVPAAIPNAELIRFNSEADTLNALQSGQADAVAEADFYNLKIMAEQEGRFRQIEGDLARLEMAIGLPAGDADWHRVVNLWVAQFNASGENRELFHQWFGIDQPAINVDF